MWILECSNSSCAAVFFVGTIFLIAASSDAIGIAIREAKIYIHVVRKRGLWAGRRV